MDLISGGIGYSHPFRHATIDMSAGKINLGGDLLLQTKLGTKDGGNTTALRGVDTLTLTGTDQSITLENLNTVNVLKRLIFDVNTLDLAGTTGTTTLTLDDTVTYGTYYGGTNPYILGVKINTLMLGQTTDIAFKNDADATINSIVVTKKNSTLNFTVDGTAAAFDASDMTLSFKLPDTIALGDVMLTANPGGSTGIALSNTTALSVTNTAGLASLNLCEKYTLIKNATGAFISQTLTDVIAGAKTHGFVANASTDLYIFKNKEVITGDHAITGPKTYTAGGGTNESILLDVSGTLTVTGGGLTMADNGTNGATLNAGTLITDQLSLNGAGAGANIGTLDVTGADTILRLTNTTAANVNIGTVSVGNGKSFSTQGSGKASITSFTAASGSTIGFELPPSIANGDTVMSVINANVGGAIVKILNGSTELTNLKKGDKVTLISGAITGTIANNGQSVNVIYGSTPYDFGISSDGSGIYAKLLLFLPGEFAKAYLESGAAKMGQLTASYDSLLSHMRTLNPMVNGNFSFGYVEGYDQKLKSGSHVDAKGMNLAVGGYTKKEGLTLGAFVETGWGSYDSHNSFGTTNVKGDGDTGFYGLGAFAKYDLPQNFYVEGSLRTGYAKSDFSSGDLTGASFDADGWYYGMHAGVGYNHKTGENGILSPSILVLWTHQQGDSVTPLSGEHVNLDAMDSVRTRLGARYTHTIDAFKVYCGAMWEHELDGEQGGSVNGVSIDNTDMGGSTGIFELGADYAASNGWTIGANISGLVGKREGVAGRLNIRFNF